MKKIILVVFFLVTYKEFVAKYQPATIMYATYPPSDNSGPYITEEDRQEKFDTKVEAEKFIREHGFKRRPDTICGGFVVGTVPHDCYDDRDKDRDNLRFDFNLLEVKEIK